MWQKVPAILLLGILLLIGGVPSIVSGQGDISPPAVVSISIEPSQFWTGLDPQTVTVTVNLKDDLSGIDYIGMRFTPEIGTTQFVDAMFGAGNLVSGTPIDGVWQDEIVLPRYAAEGWWSVNWIYGADAVGNRISLTPEGDDPIPADLLQQGRFLNRQEGVQHFRAFLPVARGNF